MSKLTNYQKARMLNDIYKKAKKFNNEDPSDKPYVYELLKSMIKKLELESKEYETAIKNIALYLNI